MVFCFNQTAVEITYKTAAVTAVALIAQVVRAFGMNPKVGG